MVFIFKHNCGKNGESNPGKNVVSVFLAFLHLVELERRYKLYNKLYRSIKYANLFFLYIISIKLKWPDCSLYQFIKFI